MSEKLRKLLNIDDLWDVESIDKRLYEYRELINYGSDWILKINPKIDILNERRRTLEKKKKLTQFNF